MLAVLLLVLLVAAVPELPPPATLTAQGLPAPHPFPTRPPSATRLFLIAVRQIAGLTAGAPLCYEVTGHIP